MIRLQFLILLAMALPVRGFAQEKPMPVTTDTPEYCDQLQARILARPHRPPEVRRLLIEGRQMCDHGEIRGGIARLRRALVMLKTEPH